MAGTLNIALTQQFDMDGDPLGGGLLYFFQAASTIPQNAFQDIALTILHPNPIILPADGRVPMFYLASTASEGNPSGQIKIRITDFTGVTILAADSLLIIGPASGGGGGGGGGVDATSVFATGDIKAHFGTEDLEGWVPCNGETIGSELSSAKYFGAEMEFLFKHLWNTTVLQVFAGTVPARGSNANDDWDANRRILLPDLKGRAIVGLDDMGSSPALRLTAAGFGVPGTVLGNAGGLETHLLAVTQIPAHAHPLSSGAGGSATVGNDSPDHGHHTAATSTSNANTPDHSHGTDLVHFAGGAPVLGSGASFGSPSVADSGTVVGGAAALAHSHPIPAIDSGGADTRHSHLLGGNTQNSTGGGNAHPNVQPSMVMTLYIKL